MPPGWAAPPEPVTGSTRCQPATSSQLLFLLDPALGALSYHSLPLGAHMDIGSRVRIRDRRGRTLREGGAMKVAVVGLGYVGTVTAACLASRGHDVWGVDVDAAKVDEIRSGRSPVAEPGLDALVSQTVTDGGCMRRPRARTLLDQADVSLVCVGTPSAARGGTDLSHVRRAVDDLVAALRVVTPSASAGTASSSAAPCPPGTVEDVVTPALADGLAGTQITIGAAMCPEFLREGSGIADFFASPFLVVGTSDPARRPGGHRCVRLP